MTDPIDCPDCGHPWNPNSEERCPGCSLSVEDLEAAADFLTDLDHVDRNP